ncbi:hypothetical protein Esti_006014 [Eimeria stiedai]
MESLVADLREGGPPDRALGGPPTRAVAAELGGGAATADLLATASTAAGALRWPDAQAAASAAAAAAAVAAAKAAAAAAAAKKGFEASSSFRGFRGLPLQQQQQQQQQQQPQQQQHQLQYASGRLLQQQQQLKEEGELEQQQQHVHEDEEHPSQRLKPDQGGFGRAAYTPGSRQSTNNCSSSSSNSSRRDSSNGSQDSRTKKFDSTANNRNSSSNRSRNSSGNKVSSNSNNRHCLEAPAVALASPAAAVAAAAAGSADATSQVNRAEAAASAAASSPAADANSGSSSNNSRGKGGFAPALLSSWEEASAAVGEVKASWGPRRERGPLEHALGALFLSGTAALTAARAAAGAQPQLAAAQAPGVSATQEHEHCTPVPLLISPGGPVAGTQQQLEKNGLSSVAVSAAAAAALEAGAAGAAAAATGTSRSSPAISQTRCRSEQQARALFQSGGLNASADPQQQRPSAAAAATGAAAAAAAAEASSKTKTSCMRVGCRSSSRCSKSSSKSSSNRTRSSSSSDISFDSSNTKFSNWLTFPPSQAPEWERGTTRGPCWQEAPRGPEVGGFPSTRSLRKGEDDNSVLQQLLNQEARARAPNPAAPAAAASTVPTVTQQLLETGAPGAVQRPAQIHSSAAAAEAALVKAAATGAASQKLHPRAFGWGAIAAPAPVATTARKQQHELRGSLHRQQQQQQTKLELFLPHFAAPTTPSSVGHGTPSLRHPHPLQHQLQHLLLQHQLRLLKQEQCFGRTPVRPQQHQLQVLQQQQQQNFQSLQHTFPPLTQQWGPSGPPFANATDGFAKETLALSAAATTAAAAAAVGLRSPCTNSGNCSSSSSTSLLSPQGWGPRTARKRALCVGCLYKGTFCELKGAAADARRWSETAATKLGFTEIMTLCEEDSGGCKDAIASPSFPSRQNILRGLSWLAEGSAAGDVALLVFSGCSCVLLSPQHREGPSTPHALALLPSDFKGWGETRFVFSAEILSVLKRLADGVQFCGVFDCAFGARLLPLKNCLTVSAHGKICVTLDAAADGSWLHPQQYHQQQQQQQGERQQQQQLQRPCGANASKFAGVFHLPQKQLQDLLLQEQAQKQKLSLQRVSVH